ncbi:Short-chain dehydrogenase TIC 32, chloroplastic [Orchesella cincta]|uniref:Short-chain dehydrogenase TIC 32, chloroplastic n=1 Tax=Orchesella cincta TaxID=48709 RepID=A0A1D2M9X1_ORCCI|nr:Short-chain dehydrogenase TIC 32, chloroplastic [Orchesella cincta]
MGSAGKAAKPPRWYWWIFSAKLVCSSCAIECPVWNMYELFTPHKKFDVKKATRRPGENVVITGGARGIGKEIVKKLLMLDLHVIMGVRNETAAKTMVDEFRKARITTGTVDILPLDLKSFESVREFATQVLQKYTKIHILINNAGLYDQPYEKTEDGYEITFQVNYLSHFLLTNMLLPKLTYAGTSEKASRIVNVSSIAHYPGKIDVDDIWMEKVFGQNWAYGNSKLMQGISSKDFNDRLVKEGYPVRSFSVHPGCIASGLYETYPKIVQGYFWLMFKNCEKGADGVLYVALSPDVEKDGGKYFQNCSTFFQNSQVDNIDVQKALWEASCKATGWKDSMNAKPKVSPNRKNTPAIVITKDSGAESISSAKSKATKDDLERESETENETSPNEVTVSPKPTPTSKEETDTIPSVDSN